MVCCAVAIFHRFPRDKEVRLKWINACNRLDALNPDTGRVCSEHFKESDYVRYLKNELLNLPLKRILKADAGPTFKLPKCIDVVKTGSSECREVRVERRNNRKEVQMLLLTTNDKDDSVNSIKNSVEEISRCTNSETPSASTAVDNNGIIVAELTKEVDHLRSENNKLIHEIICLKEKLNVSNLEIIQLKHISNVFENQFSDSQKQVLLKRKCSSWSPDDIAQAVTLRCISYKALCYIRDVIKYPLPSDATIKRRLRQFSVSPGFIDLSISILKSQSHLFSSFERDVVISFDEMKVSGEICFSEVDERIVGPHNNVQVILIRSICRKWKQPICYNFDTAVTKELILN